MKNKRNALPGPIINMLFLVFVFCTSCKGQSKTDLPKENITPETKSAVNASAPNGIVRNVMQDRKGNIWIAAFDGIFRYDGKSFTNITSKVSQARFFSVFEDSKGNLWFGSIGAGVYRYDGQSFRNFTTKDGLAGNDVSCIYEDKKGNTWFGTGGGASRYDGKSFRNFKTNEAPPATPADSVHGSVYQHRLPENTWMHNDVNAIVEDKTGKFWFGTRGYAFIYDPRLPPGQGKAFTLITNKDGKPFANVRAIIKDKKGNIWLGGHDGLWCYNGSTFTNFTRDFVGYIMEDKKGNIWTSSQRNNGLDGGFSAFDGKPILKRDCVLSRYDGKTLLDKKPIVTEIVSKEEMICGILETNDGSIWFGTSIGVYRYDGKTITSFNGK